MNQKPSHWRKPFPLGINLGCLSTGKCLSRCSPRSKLRLQGCAVACLRSGAASHIPWLQARDTAVCRSEQWAADRKARTDFSPAPSLSAHVYGASTEWQSGHVLKELVLGQQRHTEASCEGSWPLSDGANGACGNVQLAHEMLGACCAKRVVRGACGEPAGYGGRGGKCSEGRAQGGALPGSQKEFIGVRG